MYRFTLTSPFGKFSVIIEPISNNVKFETYSIFASEFRCHVAQLRINDIEWFNELSMSDYSNIKRYNHVWVKRI